MMESQGPRRRGHRHAQREGRRAQGPSPSTRPTPRRPRPQDHRGPADSPRPSRPSPTAVGKLCPSADPTLRPTAPRPPPKEAPCPRTPPARGHRRLRGRSDGATTLFVADFSDTSTAWEAYEALKSVEDGRHVAIDGVIVVKREADGIEVQEATDHRPSAAHLGLVGGAALGILFPPTLLGSAAVSAVRAPPSARRARCTTATTSPSASRPPSPRGPGIVGMVSDPGALEIRKALEKAEPSSSRRWTTSSPRTSRPSPTRRPRRPRRRSRPGRAGPDASDPSTDPDAGRHARLRGERDGHRGGLRDRPRPRPGRRGRGWADPAVVPARRRPRVLLAGALWSDTRLWADHRGSWERVAVVTDVDWVEKAVKAFGWMMPGEAGVRRRRGGRGQALARHPGPGLRRRERTPGLPGGPTRLAHPMSASGGTSTYPSSDLDLDLRWWAAANYLTVGQIYLMENPLLREPLSSDHIKPRLLGHWGTSPGLSMLYALLNRVIRETDEEMIYLAGPGHGGPALVAASSGSRAPTPRSTRTSATTRRASARCSGSSPRRAGSRATSACRPRAASTRAASSAMRWLHAVGARDRPPRPGRRLRWSATARPRPARWPRPGRAPTFLNPRRDGAVLPILHLNGSKIAGPTVLGRKDPDEDVEAYLRSQGWDLVEVAATTRRGCTTAFRRAGRPPRARSAAIQAAARGGDRATAVRPRVAGDRAADPEGLDRPVGRRRRAGRGHLAQPPGAAVRRAREPRAPAHARGVAAVLRPEDLVRRRRAARAGAARPTPEGDLRMSATRTPTAAAARDLLDLPDFHGYAVRVDAPGGVDGARTPCRSAS